MANDVSGEVWILDTTDTALKTADKRVKILGMWWDPAAADDTLVVANGNGKTIWSRTAITGAPAGQEKFPGECPFWCSGLSVTISESGGTLYVHVG